MSFHAYGNLDNANADAQESIRYQLTLPKRSQPGNFAGKIATRRVIAWANQESETVTMGSEYGGEHGDGYLLTSQTITRNPDGITALQVLTYELPENDEENETSFLTVPEDTFEETAGTMEVNIQQHPNIETIKMDWGWDDNLKQFTDPTKAFITSYLAPTIQVTHTEYSTSKPEYDVSDLGRKGELPGGKSEYGSGDDWLMVSWSRGKSGSFWTLTKVYLFSGVEWPENVYGDY